MDLRKQILLVTQYLDHKHASINKFPFWVWTVLEISILDLGPFWSCNLGFLDPPFTYRKIIYSVFTMITYFEKLTKGPIVYAEWYWLGWFFTTQLGHIGDSPIVIFVMFIDKVCILYNLLPILICCCYFCRVVRMLHRAQNLLQMLSKTFQVGFL